MIKKTIDYNKNTVLTEENNTRIDVVGTDTPFIYISEKTKEARLCKFMRIMREESGKKYWESVKPYEIIDGNLCIRGKSNIPNETGWISISKEELKQNIDVKYDAISNSFYIDLANKLEEMYNKATTFGEVTLVGDLILLFNRKLKIAKDNEDIIND